ncbi:MAG: hypothetical protein IIU68_04885, partial [Bacteroidales bacterium]|nr:hypothetical protein [Bacteroidales bacterium]
MTPIIKRNFLNNYSFASTYASSSKYIVSISIYAKKCGYVFDHAGNNYVDKLNYLPWIKKYDENVYCQFIPEETNKNEFYICYNYLSGNSSAGLITFKVNMADVQSYIDKVYPDKAAITLTDLSGKTFFEFG